MRLLRKLSTKRKILYDGVYSDDLQSSKEISLENGVTFLFEPKMIKGKKLSEFLNTLSETDKNWLLNEENITNNPPEYLRSHLSEKKFNSLNYNYYKSENHIPIEYLIENNFILLFTFGEKQPLRWILVLEGVWEFTNKPL